MQTRIFFFFLDNIVIFLHRCHFYNLLYLLYLLCFVVNSYKQSLLLNVFIECLYFFLSLYHSWNHVMKIIQKRNRFFLNRGKKKTKNWWKIKIGDSVESRDVVTRECFVAISTKISEVSRKLPYRCVFLPNRNQGYCKMPHTFNYLYDFAEKKKVEPYFIVLGKNCF